MSLQNESERTTIAVIRQLLGMKMNYINQNSKTFAASAHSYDVGLRAYMIAVYRYMSLALALTGAVSYAASSSQQLMSAIFGTPLVWVVMLAPVGMAVFMGSRAARMSAESAKLCLWLYSGLVGLSLSALFLMYTGESIARTFFITASAFGAMSIYGYTTKKDLSTYSSFFMMGMIGIVIASLVNIFMKSSALAFVVSLLGVIVFSFMTAFDVQRLRSIYREVAGDAELAQKAAVFGALSLYLDFINLFVSLLHFFGERRN